MSKSDDSTNLIEENKCYYTSSHSSDNVRENVGCKNQLSKSCVQKFIIRQCAKTFLHFPCTKFDVMQYLSDKTVFLVVEYNLYSF